MLDTRCINFGLSDDHVAAPSELVDLSWRRYGDQDHELSVDVRAGGSWLVRRCMGRGKVAGGGRPLVFAIDADSGFDYLFSDRVLEIARQAMERWNGGLVSNPLRCLHAVQVAVIFVDAVFHQSRNVGDAGCGNGVRFDHLD